MDADRRSATTRRQFLALLAAASAVGLLEACAPAPSGVPASTAAPASPTGAPAAAASGPTQAPATTAPAAAAKPAAGTLGPSQTFVYGVSADPTNIDPHQTVDGGAVLVCGAVYNMLVQLRP